MDLIDTSVWVDCFRPATPSAVRARLHGLVLRADAVLCEPVQFETLRAAPLRQRDVIAAVFDTVRRLPTPATLWRDACALGQRCAAAGKTPASMDLLIAQVALAHGARVVTLDRDFAAIAAVAPLALRLLGRDGMPRS